jgi:curli biogenesis system outer membrane secretion channel CsgG
MKEVKSMKPYTRNTMIGCLIAFSIMWLGCYQMQPIPPISKNVGGTNPTGSTNQISNSNPYPEYQGLKKRVAVVRFDVKAPKTPADAAAGLTERFITELQKTNMFEIIESEEMESVSLEGGEVIPAQVLVKGTIAQFHESGGIIDAGQAFRFDKLGLGIVKGTVVINIRMFEAATGRVICSHEAKGEAVKTAISGHIYVRGMRINTAAFEKTSLGEASMQAIKNAVAAIAENMKEIPWRGRVVSADQGTVFINAGMNSGIKVGDVIEIHEKRRELRDPETGEVLDFETARIGVAKISSIREKVAIAQILDGSGGNSGDIVMLSTGNVEGLTLKETVSQEDARDDSGNRKTEAPKMRIMVVIPEIHITRKIPDPAGETEIIRKLVERGFEVVDQSAIEAIRYGEQVKRAIKNQAEAAALAQNYDADVIIIGEAFSERVADSQGMIVCRARVEARAVKTDTASIIVADGKHATGRDISENVAAKAALRNAGGQIADYFIGEFIRDVIDGKDMITIMVSNIKNYSQLMTLESAIEGMDGVKAVHRPIFSQGVAQLNVECASSAQELGDRLYVQQFDTFKIEIINCSSNRLELEIQ